MNPPARTVHRRAAAPTNIVAGLVIAGAIVAAVIVLARTDPHGTKPPPPPQTRQADEALRTWREVRSIPTGLPDATGIAIDDGQVYVVGGSTLAVFGESGAPLRRYRLSAPASRVAAAAGTLYVTHADRVGRLKASDGSPLPDWPAVEAPADLLSVAAIGDRVFVSDHARRIVRVFDADGRQAAVIDGRIGDEGGFELPSRNVEVAAGRDGLLRVVNPGKLQIEAYSPDGQRQFTWGRGGEDIVGFNGCCNPVGVAFLPDGRVVTSEKALSTIKVFTDRQDGTLDSVVATPEAFGDAGPWDVAVDGQGRIWALIPKTGQIRIFEQLRRDDGETEPTP